MHAPWSDQALLKPPLQKWKLRAHFPKITTKYTTKWTKRWTNYVFLLLAGFLGFTVSFFSDFVSSIPRFCGLIEKMIKVEQKVPIPCPWAPLAPPAPPPPSQACPREYDIAAATPAVTDSSRTNRIGKQETRKHLS